MHPHLNKRLTADCVPQVDFSYTDDYEWATFLKGSLTHLQLPDFLADKLATPPTGELKLFLIDKWETLLRNRNGTYPYMRQVFCLQCKAVGVFKPVVLASMKRHIWVSHMKRDPVKEKLLMKAMNLREGHEFEEYTEEKQKAYEKAQASEIIPNS
jgi:hypothetical protein